MSDIIDAYLGAYRVQKNLEAELAAAKEVVGAVKEKLIALFTANNFDTVKRGDSSINVSWRSFGKVIDYQTLLGWVDNQDVPRSEYMEEVFIKGSLKNPRGIFAMIHDAQIESLQTGKTVQECLPPGLDMAVVPVVTVRSYNSVAEEVF